MPNNEIILDDLLRHNNGADYKHQLYDGDLSSKKRTETFQASFKKSLNEKGMTPKEVRNKTLAQKNMDAEIERLRELKAQEDYF